jgi:hypothetical protein
MNAQDGGQDSTSYQKEPIRFGPVLPQTAQLSSGNLEKVLDPLHVQRPMCTQEEAAGKDEESKMT